MPAKKKSSTNWETKIDEIVGEITSAISDHKSCHCKSSNKGGNAIYCLGMLGAAVYYFQHPPTGEWLLTIVKIILWPAFVAYQLLTHFSL